MCEEQKEKSAEQGLLSLTLREWRALKWASVDGHIYFERVSIPLAIRMLTVCESTGDRPHIVHELDVLEGTRTTSNTKSAGEFKHPPLKGLRKKHFSSPRYMFENIGLHWGLKQYGNENRGNRRFTQLLTDVAENFGDNPAQWPGVLAHKFVIDGYAHRAAARRLTGDWIIYSVYQGQNYYLDLATHFEGAPENAGKLMRKVRAGCEMEFPFIFP
jgi:hypothetical protein